MDDKIISFCIPTYNRPDKLLFSISSIIAQANNSQHEIVISDNSDNDDTAELVKQFQRNTTVRYYKNLTNIGSAANFARVISLAKGKYVWLMSDDDRLHTGALSRIINLLRNQSSLRYIFATRLLCDRNLDPLSGLIQPSGLREDAVFATGRDLFSALNGQMPALIGFISSTIIYKDLWDRSFSIVGTPLGNWSHARVILHAIRDAPCAILSGVNVLACSTPSVDSINSNIWIDQSVELMKTAEQWDYDSNLCWTLIEKSYARYAKMFVLDKALGKRNGNLYSLARDLGCNGHVEMNWPWALISMLPRQILSPLPWLRTTRRRILDLLNTCIRR